MNGNYCPNCHINSDRDFILVLSLDLGKHDGFVAIYTIFFFLGVISGFNIIEINLFSLIASVPALVEIKSKYTCNICGSEYRVKNRDRSLAGKS